MLFKNLSSIVLLMVSGVLCGRTEDVVAISTSAVIPTVTETVTVQTPAYMTTTVTNVITETVLPEITAYTLGENETLRAIPAERELLYRGVIDMDVLKVSKTKQSNSAMNQNTLGALVITMFAAANLI